MSFVVPACATKGLSGQSDQPIRGAIRKALGCETRRDFVVILGLIGEEIVSEKSVTNVFCG
jgi:hypothetical protein